MSDDPLAELRTKRGEEMSSSMLAGVWLAQFWLALMTLFGSFASIAAGLALAFAIFGFKTTPLLIGAYLLTALPLTAGGYFSVRALRNKLARTIARKLEARLDGLGGLLSPAALSLRPSSCVHQTVLVDGVDVQELKRTPLSQTATRKIFMLHPTCADCGAHLGALELAARIEPGGDLYDARFEWRKPPDLIPPVG